MLFYQNLSQGYDMYGEHGFGAILGSINTKTFLPGCDLVTARYASELVGQTTVWGHTFDDAPGTQYDKTRTTEAARPLMDPAEIRQLPVHRQAITVIETMPPVKWTYPKSVKVGPRSLPREYGRPRIVNFLDAERETTERRLSEANNQQALLIGEAAPVKSETKQVRTRGPQVDPETEQIIRQKTREAIGHMLDIFGGAPSPLPSSSGSGATDMARVLNQ